MDFVLYVFFLPFWKKRYHTIFLNYLAEYVKIANKIDGNHCKWPEIRKYVG